MKGDSSPVRDVNGRRCLVAVALRCARSLMSAVRRRLLPRSRWWPRCGTSWCAGPSPISSQVGLLRAALPGARIGTVDKFQGQQAPVVLYSMTSSSAAEAPRGVGFLYDINRLNVAVSRAQALTMVVMNPRLLDAQVHSPEQLRQVNALCRLVEHARSAS
jgi:hypothetical protein